MFKTKRILSIVLITVILLSSITIPSRTSAAAAKVGISLKSAVVIEGDYLYLSMKGTKQKVTWSSSDEYIASVSEEGKVTTQSTGKVTITAKVAQKKYTCKVTIIPNIDPNYMTDRDQERALAQRDYIDSMASDTIESPDTTESKAKGLPTKKTIVVGQTYTLKLNGIKGSVKWSSSNKSIVTVSEKGKIKGIKKGIATITATVGSKKYSCKVTVKPKTLFIDKSKITTSVNKNIKVVITLKTDLEETVYAELNNDTNNIEKDDFPYYSDEEIATYEFGDWNGNKLPIYITTIAPGTTNLIITTENTKEKIIIPIVIK